MDEKKLEQLVAMFTGIDKLAQHLLATDKPRRRPVAFSDGSAYAQYLASAPLSPWRSS